MSPTTDLPVIESAAYRDFGRTGLRVSPLGFGGAPIGNLNTDGAIVAEVLETLLDHGVNLIDTAHAYYGSEEAIGAARAHPSSLTMAIVDLTMPGMNGEQVYLELRKVLPDLRIVMMSGYGENASLAFLEGGASEFLQKPFTMAELREVVGA